MTLALPDGTSSTLRLGWSEGYPSPVITLEDRAIGALVSEEDGQALMNFITLAAQLDPASLEWVKP